MADATNTSLDALMTKIEATPTLMRLYSITPQRLELVKSIINASRNLSHASETMVDPLTQVSTVPGAIGEPSVMHQPMPAVVAPAAHDAVMPAAMSSVVSPSGAPEFAAAPVPHAIMPAVAPPSHAVVSHREVMSLATPAHGAVMPANIAPPCRIVPIAVVPAVAPPHDGVMRAPESVRHPHAVLPKAVVPSHDAATPAAVHASIPGVVIPSHEVVLQAPAPTPHAVMPKAVAPAVVTSSVIMPPDLPPALDTSHPAASAAMPPAPADVIMSDARVSAVFTPDNGAMPSAASVPTSHAITDAVVSHAACGAATRVGPSANDSASLHNLVLYLSAQSCLVCGMHEVARAGGKAMRNCSASTNPMRRSGMGGAPCMACEVRAECVRAIPRPSISRVLHTETAHTQTTAISAENTVDSHGFLSCSLCLCDFNPTRMSTMLDHLALE
jgi:hypothetical protein